jgi:hypothetical protein
VRTSYSRSLKPFALFEARVVEWRHLFGISGGLGALKD